LYTIFSFTEVCSISESDFNLGRLDTLCTHENTDIPTNQNTNTNDNNPTEAQTVMVWKRTRKSFSVRIEGFSYVYRSLSQKKKLVLFRCGNSKCNASVQFDLQNYWIHSSFIPSSKKTELCTIIDIEKLILENPLIEFDTKNEHACGRQGDMVKAVEAMSHVVYFSISSIMSR